MKTIQQVFLWLLIVCNFSIAQQTSSGFPKLTGPYFGQKPPGMQAELFAPGILSTMAHEHSSPAFSPDGKEVYYSVLFPNIQIEVIMFRKVEQGEWSEPEVAPFSGQYRDGGPVFSYDGLKLFYYSMRPRIEGEPPKQMDLWYVEKKQNCWGNPGNLGALINSEDMEMTLAISEKGNLYFSVYDNVKGWTLHFSEFTNGSYSAPRSCGKFVGDNFAEWCPFIAHDESYMIFSAYEMKGEENNDLYIVFKAKNGSWSQAINLGTSINTAYQEQFPKISNDGKYLFFTSNRLRIDKQFNNNYSYSEPLTYKKIQEIMNEPGNGKNDIFWVDAKTIEKLRPKD